MQTLPEWLDYLGKESPEHMTRGLERVATVAQRLAVIPCQVPVISVAGTNGKGSCVTLCAAILQAGGYRVGSYTSPHLQCFTERIAINGIPITDAQLLPLFQTINEARADIHLTFFEFATLAALLFFKQQAVEVMVLEVGLGGRLDAVNIVDANVAIITSIGLDHQALLGSTREAIGFEKAGIFRRHHPVVYGDPNPPASVLTEASQLQVPFYCQGRNFGYMPHPSLPTWDWWFDAQIQYRNLPIPKLLLPNAASALMAIHLLEPQLTISRQAKVAGLQNAFIPGRAQIIPGKITHIIDVAHNPDAVKVLVSFLTATPHATWIVFGALADKDIAAMLTLIAPIATQIFAGSLPGPRGTTINTLDDYAQRLALPNWQSFVSVTDAYQAARAIATPGDRIVVMGSFHTVAALMPLIST